MMGFYYSPDFQPDNSDDVEEEQQQQQQSQPLCSRWFAWASSLMSDQFMQIAVRSESIPIEQTIE